MPASAFHFFISPHFPSTLISFLISLFPNSLPHDGMKWCVGADVLGHSCRMLTVATESEEKAEKLHVPRSQKVPLQASRLWYSVIKEEVEMNFRWAKRRESAVTMAHLLDMIDLKVACWSISCQDCKEERLVEAMWRAQTSTWRDDSWPVAPGGQFQILFQKESV